MQRLNGPNGYDIAYVMSPGDERGAGLPTVIFMGGYRSDMEGTKALFLQEQCEGHGQAFIRFDYGGHGQSGGDFAEGTIGSWKDDALAVIDELTEGKVMLVGSSMGGWIALLCGLERPERVAGIIGLAAAPDFTREIKERLTNDHKAQLADKGYFEEPNDYSDEPYMFTQKLLEDGEARCLLDKDIALNIPVRLIQGKLDTDVPWEKAGRIKDAITGGDVAVTLIDHADHRLSRDDDLVVLGATVEELNAVMKG